MHMMRMAVVLSLGLSFEAPISLRGQEPRQQSPPEVLAVIDGKPLTRAELEHKEAARLLPARDQYYKAQREALDQLIDDAVLEMQAQREKLTVQQLLENHVVTKVKDPTEDQLEVYYEGVQTEQPFAAVRDKILEAIRQRLEAPGVDVGVAAPDDCVAPLHATKIRPAGAGRIRSSRRSAAAFHGSLQLAGGVTSRRWESRFAS